MAAPRIFFSYASEDGFWVEAFKNSKGFHTSVRCGYSITLRKKSAMARCEALDEQIERSAV